MKCFFFFFCGNVWRWVFLGFLRGKESDVFCLPDRMGTDGPGEHFVLLG